MAIARTNHVGTGTGCRRGTYPQVEQIYEHAHVIVGNVDVCAELDEAVDTNEILSVICKIISASLSFLVKLVRHIQKVCWVKGNFEWVEIPPDCGRTYLCIG